MTIENNIYDRNILLWGKEAQDLLFEKSVTVVGLGGVGASLAEALARAGIGNLSVVDFDTVSETNLNRQSIALLSEIGKQKTQVLKSKIHNINPDINVKIVTDFYTRDINNEVFSEKTDFVADAIDSAKYKLELIESAFELKIPIISSLATGNRINPEMLRIKDIFVIDKIRCSFSSQIIRKLIKRGICEKISFIYSEEPQLVSPKIKTSSEVKLKNGESIEMIKFTPASSPFVPPAAGILMASYIVRKLLSDMKILT